MKKASDAGQVMERVLFAIVSKEAPRAGFRGLMTAIG